MHVIKQVLVVRILGHNGFGTHVHPVEVDFLGVPKFGTLDFTFLYKQYLTKMKSNLKLLGDEPLENLDTWIEFFLHKHALRFHSVDISPYQSECSTYVTVLLWYCMTVR
jgi:hypothetical protein